MKKLLLILLLIPRVNYAQELELVINQSHFDTILCVKYAPNGKYFATGAKDKTIKLWDIQTGHLIRTFKGHDGAVNDIVFNSSTTQLISADSKGFVKKWELTSGKEVSSFQASSLSINAASKLTFEGRIASCAS